MAIDHEEPGRMKLRIDIKIQRRW